MDISDTVGQICDLIPENNEMLSHIQELYAVGFDDACHQNSSCRRWRYL